MKILKKKNKIEEKSKISCTSKQLQLEFYCFLQFSSIIYNVIKTFYI